MQRNVKMIKILIPSDELQKLADENTFGRWTFDFNDQNWNHIGTYERAKRQITAMYAKEKHTRFGHIPLIRFEYEK